ncbi:MAG: hypothetical protein CMD72_03450 [Gammaproteobacteria bacterium]|nr:hypothetical protein [Gammaproteobacteria bacterium]|tara:strand:+ start:512 stop:1459 length:948 start_codon:yes stop_codon:yes gene_type:complete
MSEFNDKASLNQENEVDFFEIFQIFLDNKKKLFVVTLLISFITAGYTLTISNSYTSSALLQTSEDSKSALSKLNQFSGLASMAGVSLPGSDDVNSTDYVIALVSSKNFFKDILIKHEDLLPAIMASDGYNKKNKKIIYNKKIYLDEKWIESDGYLGFFSKEKPTYLQAYRVFKKDILSLSKDKETGFINISITHHSPVFAKQLLDLIINYVNELEKDKDLKKANRSLKFLNIEANKSNILATQDAITDLISENLNIKMLANTSDSYLIEIIDSAFYPDLKTGPKRGLIVIASGLIAFIFYYFYLILRHFKFKNIK